MAVYSIPEVDEAENYSDGDFEPIDPDKFETEGYSAGPE